MLSLVAPFAGAAAVTGLEFVGVATGVGGAAAFARDLAMLFLIHGGKTAMAGVIVSLHILFLKIRCNNADLRKK